MSVVVATRRERRRGRGGFQLAPPPPESRFTLSPAIGGCRLIRSAAGQLSSVVVRCRLVPGVLLTSR